MTSSFMYQTIFLATPSKSAFPGGLPVSLSLSDLHWTGAAIPGDLSAAQTG